MKTSFFRSTSRSAAMVMIIALIFIHFSGSLFAIDREVVRTQEIVLDANGGVFPKNWPDEESITRTVEFEIYEDGSVSFINVGLRPEKEGKVQLGWSTTKNGTEEYDTQTFYEIGFYLSKEHFVPLDGSVTKLYAVWTDVWTITLDANGGDFGTSTDRFGKETPIETTEARFWRDSNGSLWRTNDKIPQKEGDEIHKGWSGNKQAVKPEYGTGFAGLELNESTPETLYAVYGLPDDPETDYEDPSLKIPISSCEVSNLQDMTYTGKKVKPDIVISSYCCRLVENEDYTLRFKNNVNAGKATIIITGKGSYTGTMKVNFTIKPKSIKKVKVSGLKQLTYTGKKLTQKKVVVKDGSKKLVNKKDYTLTYKNNTAAGKAKVVLKGKGNYTGKTAAYFMIKPAETSIASVKNTAKGTVKVKWTAVRSGTGYEIGYGLKKNFKGASKVEITKRKTVSTSIKDLKKGKTYYFRIRPYVTVDGQKIYGKWSSKVKVRIRK